MPRGKKSEPFGFEIVEEVATLQEFQGSDWNIELNKVAWGGNPPVIDIRRWNRGGEEIKCGKGITLSDEACEILAISLLEMGYGDTKSIAKIYNARKGKK